MQYKKRAPKRGPFPLLSIVIVDDGLAAATVLILEKSENNPSLAVVFDCNDDKTSVRRSQNWLNRLARIKLRVVEIFREQQRVSKETQGCPDVGADARRKRSEVLRQFRLQGRMRGQGQG